ncbi:MAG: metallophosphoesterase [Deltaproteobacteria bacterium]|nr:metallophosphoesterase [Deltaproteobacteria bacterium]
MKKFVVLIFLLLLGTVTFLFVKRQRMVPSVRFDPIVREQAAQDVLHFFAIGDTGSGDARQYEVAQAMEKRCKELDKLDGLLFLGDHFYFEGVSSTEDPQWEEKLEKPYSLPCLGKAKIFPVFGNHDYRGNVNAFIEYSRKNQRWSVPHRFYSVKFGDLLKVVAFDSSVPDWCFSSKHCAVDFLQEQLDGSTRWQIVTAHHPLFSSDARGYSYTGNTPYGVLMRWLFCDKFDVWLSGHSHRMEHLKAASCGHQLISGGGGGDLDPDSRTDGTVRFSSPQHGFLELEVSKDAMQMRFWDTDGLLRHEAMIQEEPGLN